MRRSRKITRNCFKTARGRCMKKILLIIILCLISVCTNAANYRTLDSRAQRVPKQYEESLPKLVQYLIEPYQNDEEKKARVLLGWIVYHIDYDDYKADTIVKSNRRRRGSSLNSGDIFETRVGVCEDIANLYQRMLGLAGLDSVVVSGYAGFNVTRQTKPESRHAWNAVKIDGKWELIDPTWAMRGDVKALEDIGSNLAHKRELRQRLSNTNKTNKTRKNRTVDNRWFMTKPQEMIKSHFPDDEKWQLLAVPKKLNSFLK